MSLDESYWDERYKSGQTGWDLGAISEPLKTYFDQLTDPDIRILIPGGGNSYEAEYLFNKGFKNIFVIDLSQNALENFAMRVPEFPKDHLIHDDFFNLNGKFDLIIEQTFFCALDPSLRPSYARQMHSLLYPQGKLAGLLFNFPLTSEGPPFGGDLEEYKNYFEPFFQIEILKPSYNSIPPRSGRELFFKLKK